MVSVQRQIVSWWSLYLLSEAIVVPQVSSLGISCRLLFHWTCHFWVGLHCSTNIFFYLKASPMSGLQHEWGCGSLLFNLTCSVILGWGAGHWKQIPLGYVVVLEVDEPHWTCHWQMWHVLSGSTHLSVPFETRGHCPKWALCFMHFPGLSQSGT